MRVDDVGRARTANLSRFSLTAPQNLVLFIFINAMASGSALVTARRNGILRRALAMRSGMGSVLLGLGVGWFVLSLAQSLLILGVGALLFGVRWGDPLGAGLLVGTLGENEDRVTSITPILGIVLGALGGCMVPLEVFPSAMRAIAHAVPHYWAVRGWQRLVFDGAGVGGIAGPLAVLGAVAVVLLGGAAVLLRRELVRG